MDFSRVNIRPWELDLLTYDDYLTFKVRLLSGEGGVG